MKKGAIGIIIALIVIGGAVALFASQKSNNSSYDSTSSSKNSTDKMSNMDNQSTSMNSGSVVDMTAQTSVSIDISNYAFSQKDIKIKKGTKVTWTNKDSVKHTVTSDDGSSKGLDSALLANGESYSYTFDTVSTYKYHCTPHPYMKASVTVVE